MRKHLLWTGLCLVFPACFAIAESPILLDWGTLDTSSHEARSTFQQFQKSAKTHTLSLQQKSDASQQTAYLVQFQDVIQEEWKTALEDAGAYIQGYMPENAFLVLATLEAIASISTLEAVYWVGEWLPAYKQSQCIGQRMAHATTAKEIAAAKQVRIAFFDGVDLGAVVLRLETLADVQVEWVSAPEIRVSLSSPSLEEIATWAEVQWIESYYPIQPLNDIAVQRPRMNITNLWPSVDEGGLGLTGAGQIVAVCDSGLDTGNIATIHPDFAGRIRWTQAIARSNDWSDPSYSYIEDDGETYYNGGHGTHVAGSVLGSGAASSNQYKGVAYEAELVFQSVMDSEGNFSGLSGNYTPIFHSAYTNGARIHSDSWGSAQNGAYGLNAQYMDQFAWTNKDMLFLVSAGNSGVDANRDGIVDLGAIGSPATAKNVLSVGSAENWRLDRNSRTWGWGWPDKFPTAPLYGDPRANATNGMAASSSRGPCTDGRIKPDIVAPGSDIISARSRAITHSQAVGSSVAPNTNYLYKGGTSMATPLTAGAAALVRQYLIEQRGITNPSAALMKALLINGARNMAPGQYGTGSYQEIPYARPNNVTGYGHVDLGNTLLLNDEQFLHLHDDNIGLATGQNYTTKLVIGEPITNAFIITLAYTDYFATSGSGKKLVNDLDLTVTTPSGTILYPNGLGKLDATNNVEMIEFAPSTTGVGSYTIKVNARTVPSGTRQPFALVTRGVVTYVEPMKPSFLEIPTLHAAIGVPFELDIADCVKGYPIPDIELQSSTANPRDYTLKDGYLVFHPSAQGTYPFTVEATNSEGTATTTLTVLVSAVPTYVPVVFSRDITSNSFSIHWTACTGAMKYQIQVAADSQFTAEETHIIFDETFGTGASGNPAFGVWTAYSSTGLTFSGTGDIRSTNPSGGYIDASGGNNAFLNVANANLVISGVNASGYETLNLTYGIRKNTAAYTGEEVSIAVSLDGSNWTNLDSMSALGSSSGWYLRTNSISSTFAQQDLRIQISAPIAAQQWRFDDVKLWGTRVIGEGSVLLDETASALSYSVVNLDPKTTYYIRVRMANGQWSSALPVTTLEAGTVAPVFSIMPPQSCILGDVLEFDVSHYVTGYPVPTISLISSTVSSDDYIEEDGYLLFRPSAQGTFTFTFEAANSSGVATGTVTVVASTALIYVPTISASGVTSNTFTANWTACTDAASYQIQVSSNHLIGGESVATTLLSETFSKFTANSSTDISTTLNSYTSASGWSGIKVFCNNGEVKLGSTSATGNITTPALSEAAGNIAITFNAYSTKSAVLTVSHAANGSTFFESAPTITLTATKTSYTCTFANATSTSNIKWANELANQAFMLDDILITLPFFENDSWVNETVSALNYLVTGLEPETTYYVRVRMLPDGEWSTILPVTTLANGNTPSPEIEITSLTMNPAEGTLSFDFGVHDVFIRVFSANAIMNSTWIWEEVPTNDWRAFEGVVTIDLSDDPLHVYRVGGMP